MIGQEKLLSQLKNNLPLNLLLVGKPHSGKITLINELAEYYNYPISFVDHNVSSIRSTIYYEDTLYIFEDLDEWSKACCSSLLKILEENRSIHFIITVKNIQNIPNTISSRCQVFQMQPYTIEQIGNELCSTVGEAKLFSEDLLNFVDKVIDNMLTTSIWNIFKLENSIKLKESDEGFDFYLFFNMVESRLYQRIILGTSDELKDQYSMFYYITTKYNSRINMNNLNKQKFLWNWILDMRGESDGWKSL